MPIRFQYCIKYWPTKSAFLYLATRITTAPKTSRFQTHHHAIKGRAKTSSHVIECDRTSRQATLASYRMLVASAGLGLCREGTAPPQRDAPSVVGRVSRRQPGPYVFRSEMLRTRIAHERPRAQLDQPFARQAGPMSECQPTLRREPRTGIKKDHSDRHVLLVALGSCDLAFNDSSHATVAECPSKTSIAVVRTWCGLPDSERIRQAT
ncbi:hypothetical protein BH11PSE5_BH11PSE5_16400 [soil metagenome]